MRKNYYEILGVSRNATLQDIKDAYIEKSVQCHPVQGYQDPFKFREISEAYQVLSDANKRHKYDNPEEDKFNFNFRDEHKLFKDFYRKGTFDENKEFNSFKNKWMDDDKFFKSIPDHNEKFNQTYGKEESTETIEENGVRKTIYRSKITHPDG